MHTAQLCYTRRVPKANSQRGVWMKDLRISISRTRTRRKIRQWGVGLALFLATLVGIAITASAQAPKRTVIREGRVLNVRTGELRRRQTIVIEVDTNSASECTSELK